MDHSVTASTNPRSSDRTLRAGPQPSLGDRFAATAAHAIFAVGNRADLVLLHANPLASVATLTQRAGVMVKGRWVSSAEIDRGLAQLAEKYAQ